MSHRHMPSVDPLFFKVKSQAAVQVSWDLRFAPEQITWVTFERNIKHLFNIDFKNAWFTTIRTQIHAQKTWFDWVDDDMKISLRREMVKERSDRRPATLWIHHNYASTYVQYDSKKIDDTIFIFIKYDR